uniref:Uncharacterized protein n=1 Tax=uncultured delta proteobacterium HF0130_20J24 TaxID=710829 RepID=E0XXQ9_9DELT|nr:hypothetical protein [uncultured delta proteobacterium HF0130_20J24]
MFGMGTGVTPLPEAPTLKSVFLRFSIGGFGFHISITYERVSSGINLFKSGRPAN